MVRSKTGDENRKQAATAMEEEDDPPFMYLFLAVFSLAEIPKPRLLKQSKTHFCGTFLVQFLIFFGELLKLVLNVCT